MPVTHVDISDDLRCITLSGRLDIQGTEDIADKFAELSATSKRYVVVDFTSVTFLASYGIRALISNAKAFHKSGGRMAVVVGENFSVARTLETVGINALLQVYKELQEAKKAFYLT